MVFDFSSGKLSITEDSLLEFERAIFQDYGIPLKTEFEYGRVKTTLTVTEGGYVKLNLKTFLTSTSDKASAEQFDIFDIGHDMNWLRRTEFPQFSPTNTM